MDRSGDRGDCIYPAVFADEGAEPKELYGNHSWRRGRCLLEWWRIRQMGVGVLYAAGDLRLQRPEVLSIHWNRLAVAHGLGTSFTTCTEIRFSRSMPHLHWDAPSATP